MRIKDLTVGNVPASLEAAKQRRPGVPLRKPLGTVDPNELAANFMGDTPDCDVCEFKTVRSAACYKCLNCGNSMGCS